MAGVCVCDKQAFVYVGASDIAFLEALFLEFYLEMINKLHTDNLTTNFIIRIT